MVMCRLSSLCCIVSWQCSLGQVMTLKRQAFRWVCNKNIKHISDITNEICDSYQITLSSLWFPGYSLFLSSPVHSQPSQGHLIAKERIFRSVALSEKTSGYKRNQTLNIKIDSWCSKIGLLSTSRTIKVNYVIVMFCSVWNGKTDCSCYSDSAVES